MHKKLASEIPVPNSHFQQYVKYKGQNFERK